MRILKLTLLACALAILLSTAVQAEITITPQPVGVSGVITAIDLVKRTVTVAAPPEATGSAPRLVTFFVTDRTVVRRNEAPARLADLRIKDQCKAQLVKGVIGLVALTVVAKAPPPPVISARGKIDEIRLDARTFFLRTEVKEGDTVVVRSILFAATSTTRIFKDGKAVGFGDLKAGDLATVAYLKPAASVTPVVTPIPALAIEARTPPVPIIHVTGKIVSIGSMGIVVQPATTGAPRVAFTVTPATKIDKFGPAGYDALLVEDTVDVAFYAVPPAATVIPTALSIKVLPRLYKGTLVAVDLVKGTVTVQASPTGPAILFKVVDRTEIIKNGVLAPLKALALRDIAEVKFFRFREINVAARIGAKSPVIVGVR